MLDTIIYYRYYKQATKLDESSVLALSGIIACQLREKQFEVAREQLDFLKEIQVGKTAYLTLAMSNIETLPRLPLVGPPRPASLKYCT